MRKKILYFFLILILLGNIYIIISGKTFFYTALYYNFTNIDDYKIFENRIIHKSSSPEPWKISSQYNKIPVPDTLQEFLTSHESVAFLLVKNDSILAEQYWDGYGLTSFSNSFSMAKTYTSALIGAAIREGKIKSVEQPVLDFLPEFKEGEKSKIRIKHLLTMSGGLDWTENYIDPLSTVSEAYYGKDLRAIIDRLKASEQPGVTFRYKGCDTQILAFILEKATGMKLSDYASQVLWGPTGAENDALWSLDHKDGDEKASCCVNSNARDFARLGKLYLNLGNWEGKQLIDSSYVQASLVAAPLVNKEGEKVDFYGYKWWLIPQYKSVNIFYARGIMGQYIIVIPSRNIVIVHLGKKVGKRIGYHFEEVYKIVDWALAI